MGSFTIITGKEGSSPKKPLFLVTVTAPDGDVCYLTSSTYYGGTNLTYNGHTYLARIQRNEFEAIQAMSPQGYDSVPGFHLTLADADKFLWTNHCWPHGWRGSNVTLTIILWDVVANQYSTDAIQYTFIGGNPQHNHSAGTTTLDVTSATNFTRIRVPSIPLQYRCPWTFPATAAQRAAALNDPTSIYYECGYSPDQPGGIGNYQSGSTPFTTCDYTRSSSSDPSVGCMARLGKASATSVAPDGDLTHDIAGNYTARFGGVTWLAPTQYSGRQYTSGNKVFGFNQPNTAIAGQFFNWVYGTQWVPGQVLAPAGEPNSLRSEVAVCIAPYGQANVLQVVVNGVIVPQGNSDQLFTWRYITQGGRSGALNGDIIFDNKGDPHGSLCVIEFVVPAELAAPGSVPSCQVLVTGDPTIQVYPIASISGGVVTFTGPNTSCAGNPPFTVRITGNSNSSLNGDFTLTNWTGGPPGTVTLNGTSASGTGGALWFFSKPDLWDTGGSIVTNPTGMYNNIAGPACNLVWSVLDLMTWGNITLEQFDAQSWFAAAQIAATQISYKAADGSSQTHAQFKASFALRGDQRQTLSQVLAGLRNAGNLMIAPNSTTGLIQCFVRQTLCDQQPSPVPGSNDSTPRSSVHADLTSGTGYYAYTFNETNIEIGSFRVTTTRIESTPNTVSTAFQDEYNGYVQDSITEIDPVAYLYSGNQEIQVPVPIIGAPNFDQLTRIANVQIAEALFGNPRDDAGGTLYFEFTVNQRVLHLASRLGYICGLTWQSLGIGTIIPQPIRLLSLTPDTDGEHWQVKAAWHQDVWYTYAYGQNPAPFQQNPLALPPNRPPYPWQPNNSLIWPFNDDLFAGAASFAIGINQPDYSSQITVKGSLPINAQPSIPQAAVPLQASSANTGGSIDPGNYYICLVLTNGSSISSPSGVIVAAVPTGTSTNTISIQNISYPDAAFTVTVYAGESPMEMVSQGNTAPTGNVVGSNSDSNGNPQTITISAITPVGPGLPDVVFSKLRVQGTMIIHGGVWGDAVTSTSGSTVTFAAASWTTNQWAGYILSLYYRPSVSGSATTMPGLNRKVLSNTANVLTLDHASTFLAGDVVVLRMLPSSISSNTIGDPNFVNSYAPSGLTVNAESGNLIWIIAGTGAGQRPKTIVSNTATVLTIDGAWDITPDATSVPIITAPAPFSDQTTSPMSQTPASAGTTRNVVATGPIPTSAQSVLVQVATADVNGNIFPMSYQPFRELWVPGSSQSPGYYTITPASGSALVNLGNGLKQRLVLNGSAVSVSAPSNGGGGVSAGDQFTLYLDQDSTGNRDVPTFAGGGSGFASDTQSKIRAAMIGTASTRTAVLFTFHGSVWCIDSAPLSGIATS